MKVKVEYNDIDSLTKEEAIDRVKHLLGKSISIEVYPDSTSLEDILRFALTQLISYEQVCLLNDSPYDYKEKLLILKKQVMNIVESHLNSVILANECKFRE